MTNYPPTPAFGVFPLPAPKGPPNLSQDLRKLSINSVASNNTTLPSPAIQSPNYLSKFPYNSSASRQPPSGPPSAVSVASPNPSHAPPSGIKKSGDGLPEDREEGELSDAEDVEESHVNKHNNSSGNRLRDRGAQNQQGREFVSHGMRTNGEAPNHPTITRSQTWNEPYRRETASQGWNQQGSNRNGPSGLSSAGPPKAPRGNLRDRKPGSGNIASPPSGPKNQSSSFHPTAAAKGMHINNSPVHISTPQSPLETPKAAVDLRSEAQRAVLNMLPLKVTFKYMVEEAGIDANVLKKVFTGIGLPLPTETPSPSPTGDIDRPHRGIAKNKSREKLSERIEIDKEAQFIRKQLEKDARDRERKEAEAKAAELVRQREAAKEEEEKKRRLAEVEAKKEVLRRKIDEMKLPGKSASPGTPLTPISSTPVMEAISRVPAMLPPKPERPRIPGLLLGQLDGYSSDTSSLPETMSEQCDTIMKDSPEPTSQSSGHSTRVSTAAANISPGSVAIPSPERPLAQRRKRPVASDMYSEPMPTTKRKFGDQRKVPIELIIDVSDEEEEEEEEEDGSQHTGDGSGTSRSTPFGADPRRSTANGNGSPPRLRLSRTAPVGGFAANGAHSKLDSAKALQDKEEQIRALKEAIQKAQQQKKMRAKPSIGTPTPVGTPTIGTGPSVPPPLTQKQQQQQETNVTLAVSSALDSTKKEDEMTRQKAEKRQKMLVAQAAQAKADAIKLKESRIKEKEEKLKVLLTEIEEIEKSKADKRRKQAEEAEATEKRRQQAKEEMKKRLQEVENERLQSRMALMKIRQELERMQREESEKEAKKEALKAEIAAMEKAVEQTVDIMGEGGEDAANQVISKKKEEIEQLKKAMECEVDYTDFEAVTSPISPIFGKNTASPPGLQLANPEILEHLELGKTNPQDDFLMEDNVNTGVNGLVGTYQRPQAPVLERTEAAASHVLAVSLPISADAAEDRMELDQPVNEEEKVTGNDVYTDVDMDAQSDEDGDEEEQAGEITEEEEDSEGEKQPEPKERPNSQILDARHLPASIPVVSSKPTLEESVVAPKSLEKNAVVEEANLPTSVPERGSPIEELVDPIKITSATPATTSDIKKLEQEKTQKQPEHVFSPYISPLTNFKSFRYHPNFLDYCPDGFKSLTFTNRLDPMRPLCRWELSGGTCSDTSCVGQHQKQIEIPDDEILVDLAALLEGSNEEERDNYKVGLWHAIATMRAQGIRDISMIGAGIVAYRRRFLGDATRIIKLPNHPAQFTSTPQPNSRVPSSFSSYT